MFQMWARSGPTLISCLGKLSLENHLWIYVVCFCRCCVYVLQTSLSLTVSLCSNLLWVNLLLYRWLNHDDNLMPFSDYISDDIFVCYDSHCVRLHDFGSNILVVLLTKNISVHTLLPDKLLLGVFNDVCNVIEKAELSTDRYCEHKQTMASEVMCFAQDILLSEKLSKRKETWQPDNVPCTKRTERNFPKRTWGKIYILRQVSYSSWYGWPVGEARRLINGTMSTCFPSIKV